MFDEWYCTVELRAKGREIKTVLDVVFPSRNSRSNDDARNVCRWLTESNVVSVGLTAT